MKLVEYPYFLPYLFTALEAAPRLFAVLLEGITDAQADWRPDPDRFTIREVMAHLADWESIFLERVQRICAEDCPDLPDIDEGQRAEEREYGKTDPQEQLQLFGQRRERVVQFLKARTADEWQRRGNRPEIGELSLESFAALRPLHDMYHLDQVREWRRTAPTHLR